MNGAYYRRVQQIFEDDANQTVFEFEPVTPRTVLAASARNLSGGGTSEGLRLEVRIALTGDTVTTFEELEEDGLGNIYRLDASYYTVVKTDRTVVDHGLDILRYEVPRYAMAAIGGVLVAGVLTTEISG